MERSKKENLGIKLRAVAKELSKTKKIQNSGFLLIFQFVIDFLSQKQ